MAAEFLATHGIDLQATLSDIQFPTSSPSQSRPSTPPPPPVTKILSVVLPTLSPTGLYDLILSPITNRIISITPSPQLSSFPPRSPSPSTLPPLTPQDPPLPSHPLSLPSLLALPSLCHPHIHLDKAFLYSSQTPPQPIENSFTEALDLTSKAKTHFTRPDLLQRGGWLLAESVAAGVTHMRAFVEADQTVGHLCVEVGLELKHTWQDHCDVQLCLFAQDPVFSPLNRHDSDSNPNPNRVLFESALTTHVNASSTSPAISALGSAPYVEHTPSSRTANIAWAISLAIQHHLHLDFHLDYNLDPTSPPLIWAVLSLLHSTNWTQSNPDRTVCLGHCTRLTLFSEDEWARLKCEVEDLPVWFVGLPTSDLFMMGRPAEQRGDDDQEKPISDDNGEISQSNKHEPAKVTAPRPRGTLPIPTLINKYNLSCAIGINNVGNAFTPYGSVDPLCVASLCVGVYQAGTREEAELLYECISTRARTAIGFPPPSPPSSSSSSSSLTLLPSHAADIVLYGVPADKAGRYSRRRRTVQEIVYDAGVERVVIKGGRRVAG